MHILCMHPALGTPDQPAEVDLLQTGDVARMLEVSAETVRLWERLGRLPALKTERGVRLFHRRDVERLAREREARRAASSNILSDPVGVVAAR
jgi:hypothetical protein